MNNKILPSCELTQDLATEFYNSAERFPVRFDDAYVWLGYSTKGNAKRAFMKCGFVENVDYELIIRDNLRPQGGYSGEEVINITCECLKVWGMMSKTAKGQTVRNYFLECEAIAKRMASITAQTQQESLLVLQEFHQLKQTVSELVESQDTKIERAITARTQHLTKMFAVQQNLLAQQMWEQFSFEFEKELNKVRAEWMNFYEHYKTQEDELKNLKVEFEIFFQGKFEGIAPGWNPQTWRNLPTQDKLNFWKKHKLDGWVPSDQFENTTSTNLLSPVLEENLKQSQKNELSKILGNPTQGETERIEEMKNKLFLRLDSELT